MEHVLNHSLHVNIKLGCYFQGLVSWCVILVGVWVSFHVKYCPHGR